jgi:hypothetical protein
MKNTHVFSKIPGLHVLESEPAVTDVCAPHPRSLILTSSAWSIFRDFALILRAVLAYWNPISPETKLFVGILSLIACMQHIQWPGLD